MSLSLKVELVKDNGVLNLKFTDETGTGYYTGTKAVGNIDVLSVQVTKPDGTTTGTYDIFTNGVSDGNISSISNFALGTESILLTHNELFGSSGDLIDGNYDVVYTIGWSTEGSDETQELTLLAYKTVYDCIQGHIADLTIPKCECKWDTLEIWMVAAFYMDTLKAQACLGEESKFLNTLSSLQKICTLGNSVCQPCSC